MGQRPEAGRGAARADQSALRWRIIKRASVSYALDTKGLSTVPFCPQCGADNLPSARFCDQCGAVLIPVPAQGAATPATPTPGATMPAIPAPAAPAAPAQPAASGGQISAGPSVCPQCGTAVIPGEAFCDTCGAALLGPMRPAQGAGAPGLPFGGVPPQPSYPPPQPVAPQPQPTAPAAPTPIVTPPIVTPPQPAQPARTSLAPTRLVVQRTGAVVPLPATTQVVIGRADAVSNFFPDLDLTTHGALEAGVGRRHARLFVQGGALLVEDLDSTNGTFLNGTRLAPRQPARLGAGDELRLGNLTLRVEL